MIKTTITKIKKTNSEKYVYNSYHKGLIFWTHKNSQTDQLKNNNSIEKGNRQRYTVLRSGNTNISLNKLCVHSHSQF